MISTILILLQKPVVLYTIVLIIIWFLIQIISKLNDKITISFRVNDKYVYVLLVVYVFFSLFLTQINIKLFPYLHAMALALALCFLYTSPEHDKKLTMIMVIMLMPLIVPMLTKHPLPLGDDCRLSGFATAINKDGRWIPFKYVENTYYQFFHVVPFVEYALASITGVSFTNITIYYLTLKTMIYLAIFMLTYLVVRELTNDDLTSFTAVILLSITPPLLIVEISRQMYVLPILLTTVYFILKRVKKAGLKARACIAASYILWVAGVIVHATYTLMVLAFALPLILIGKSQVAKTSVARSVVLLGIISLAYWMYTYVLDILIRPGINSVTRLIDLLTGRALPFIGAAQSWYIPEMSMFFIAWALVPSITVSYILLSIPEALRSGKILTYFKDNSIILGLLGLGGTALNYVLRSLPTFGGRYFYWLYLLMLPLSAISLRGTSKKLLGLILAIALIPMVSFYGVQDPTLAANTYGDYIGWADRTSWEIGLSLAPYLDPKATTWLDSRIGGPISSLSPQLSEPGSTQHVFVVIGIDRIGLHRASYSLREIEFFIKHFGLEPKDFIANLDDMNVVFSGGTYVGVWVL